MALLIFVTAIAFAVYTLVGYPILLVLLARLRGRDIRGQLTPRTVSVLLPVRNGERWIAAKLDTILGLDYPQELIDTIVISDASTDGTDEIVRDYATRHRVRLLRVPWGGKAAALSAGLEQATGEILFFTDVRQRLAPDSLRHLVAAFGDPEVGAVSGELMILAGDHHESADVGLYWKYEKWIRRTMSRIDSFHGVTGSIYALRRNLAAPIPPGTLNDDMYLPLRAFLKGHRIAFESRAIAEDFPTLLDAEFRRKVRTLAGVYQIIGELPELVSPRNRMWFHFMSHKVFRLFLPYALIAAIVSSWFLPQPLGLMAMAAEAAVFLMAAFDRVLPKGSLLKRVSSPARTFIVMMAATVCAAAILFVPPEKLWGETKVVEAKRGQAV